MFAFVGCGIKPGCSSACCGAKNSDTEILMKASVQKHKNYNVFFRIVFTLLCIHIFMSGMLHDKREN